jgi:hypothetical protein
MVGICKLKAQGSLVLRNAANHVLLILELAHDLDLLARTAEARSQAVLEATASNIIPLPNVATLDELEDAPEPGEVGNQAMRPTRATARFTSIWMGLSRIAQGFQTTLSLPIHHTRAPARQAARSTLVKATEQAVAPRPLAPRLVEWQVVWVRVNRTAGNHRGHSGWLLEGLLGLFGVLGHGGGVKRLRV